MNSLALLQLVSPALPVGAFSYSEGLEFLVQMQKINDSETLISWLEAELIRGNIAFEAAALWPLHQALKEWKLDNTKDEAIRDLASWLLALRDASEMRAQHLQMGRSLFQLMADLGDPLPDDSLDLGWTVAWAWAALVWEVTPLEGVQGYLYGWVANQLSAAVRLIPIGPTKAQVIQRRLQPLIESQAIFLLNENPQKLWNGGIGAAMAQLSHAELYSRLFRS